MDHTLKGNNMTCQEKLRIATETLEEHIYTMKQIEGRITEVTAKLAGINALMRVFQWDYVGHLVEKKDDAGT